MKAFCNKNGLEITSSSLLKAVNERAMAGAAALQKVNFASLLYSAHCDSECSNDRLPRTRANQSLSLSIMATDRHIIAAMVLVAALHDVYYITRATKILLCLFITTTEFTKPSAA